MIKTCWDVWARKNCPPVQASEENVAANLVGRV